MKKFIYFMLLLFVFILGLKANNNVTDYDINDRIEDFENKIESGDDLSLENDYVISENPVNSLAKKTESIIAKLMDKLKGYLS